MLLNNHFKLFQRHQKDKNCNKKTYKLCFICCKDKFIILSLYWLTKMRKA